MAKYILAASTDRPLGSRGGATFQRAGKIFIIRHRMSPVQKRSVKQSQVKNIFDFASKHWRTLSIGQKNTFAVQASNYPRNDSIGNPYTLRPNALQTSSNTNLVTAGSPPIDIMTPPAGASGYVIVGSGIEIGLQVVSAIPSSQFVPNFHTFKIYISNLINSPGENQNLNYKLIASLQSGEDGFNKNYWNEYLSAWGDPSGQVGKFFYCRADTISTQTGQLTDRSYTDGEVIA